MTDASFIHLRLHSAYSLSEGAIRIDQPKKGDAEIVELCRQHNMPAVGLTDTNNLFGSLAFSQVCSGAGIQPVMGCQLNITPPADRASGRANHRLDPDQVVLLVQNENGWENLLKLVSHAHLESEGMSSPQVSMAELLKYNEGLLLFTGGPQGPVGRYLLDNRIDPARAMMQQLHDVYSDRLYVELMRHGLDDENRIEQGLVDLAYDMNIPLIATNDCYFGPEDMYEAHDALLCIANSTYVDEQKRRRVTANHRFRSAEEMTAVFEDLPEAVMNTVTVARRCAFMVEKRAPILPSFPTVAGRTEAEELRARAHDGLDRRLERQVLTPEMSDEEKSVKTKEYKDRLDFELNVIIQMDFPGYFLIVAEFIQWAKDHGIPVGPGRGSGAGSVVAWSLTITDLDPLEFGLLFERFLNPERVSMPDFDIDFCQDHRDKVITHVQELYGRDRVAQIITFGKLQARAVLRDVGRVLQMPYGQVDKLCKMVPNNPAKPTPLSVAVKEEAGLRHAREDDERVGRLIDIALKLEGLYRHASTHAAGVVIGDRPLDELVPLYRDPRSDMPVTQYSMKHVESVGLVKFDFLGLKTLTVVETARKLTAQSGTDIDLETLALDDRASFEMLGKADSTGVFQLESSGMRDVLRKMKPDSVEDLIALVALYRPGPMENIPRYIECKHGREQPEYLHELLKPILEETFGVVIYQEQVMEIAKSLAGYTLGGADLLRRAMGKKIAEEMAQQRQIFVEGAAKNGLSADLANQIFDYVDKFAGYGFNKSHAACYALIAYQTAYLKANHPVEFFAASMTLDMGNTEKLSSFRQELQKSGLGLLPPDINHSEADFSVDNGAVRYALAAIRNVGHVAVEGIVRERKANGPFRSLADFAGRIDSKSINKRMMENLVRAGAFDGLEPNRARLLSGLDMVMAYANRAASERDSGQVSLFGGGDVSEEPLMLPDAGDWSPMERLNEEFSAIGFYLSAHPLDMYGPTLQRLKVKTIAEVPAYIRTSTSGTRINLAGVVSGRQERTSAKGNRFAFIQMSDATGVFELTAFSEVLAGAREHLDSGRPLMVTADAQLEGDGVRLTAQHFQILDEAAKNVSVGLTIYLDDPGPVEDVKSLLERVGRGSGEVTVISRIAMDREVSIRLSNRYKLNMEAASAVKSLPGVVDAQVI
ncbi:DNA polymerase III subunit alpha [Alphaproteobacteria bacterium HT1-32]|nr:DNA polymerase III subunit alpha [Alphaproteobacteria bacterium HT1-32]